MDAVLFSSYFPNIQYLSKFHLFDNIIIDVFESYSKQTFRNRTQILSANGLLNLSIPVKTSNHTLTKDVEIDYSTSWQNNHLRAIMSAYRNAPFYDYYFDTFKFVFFDKQKFLIDLNNEILYKLIDIFNLDKKSLTFSLAYIKPNLHKFVDCREIIHPKRSASLDLSFCDSESYIQVFSDRYDFFPNLSTLDLLFNYGAESLLYLKSSVNT